MFIFILYDKKIDVVILFLKYHSAWITDFSNSNEFAKYNVAPYTKQTNGDFLKFNIKYIFHYMFYRKNKEKYKRIHMQGSN